MESGISHLRSDDKWYCPRRPKGPQLIQTQTSSLNSKCWFFRIYIFRMAPGRARNLLCYANNCQHLLWVCKFHSAVQFSAVSNGAWPWSPFLASVGVWAAKMLPIICTHRRTGTYQHTRQFGNFPSDGNRNSFFETERYFKLFVGNKINV